MVDLTSRLDQTRALGFSPIKNVCDQMMKVMMKYLNIILSCPFNIFAGKCPSITK